jgi:hypothetical protein
VAYQKKISFAVQFGSLFLPDFFILYLFLSGTALFDTWEVFLNENAPQHGLHTSCDHTFHTGTR